MTYNQDGLAVNLDSGGVIIYLEEQPVIEMTRDEFKSMAGAVLAEMEEVE